MAAAARSHSHDSVLFVFAHQDDELPVLTRILYELASGNRVRCAYLTDGASTAPAVVRDRESLAMLTRIGVSASDIGFLGGEQRIADGRLAFYTSRAVQNLRDFASEEPPRRMYTLDWEGGHPDHDACHVVALKVACEIGVSDVLSYSLYNGYRRPAGWFRVTSLVPAASAILARSISVRDALFVGRALLHYRSQRRTWLGLGPGLLFRMLWRREERFRLADPQRVARRPHEGPLLYETMFKTPADVVLGATEALRDELVRTS